MFSHNTSVPKMTYTVSGGTLNPTHSLTIHPLQMTDNDNHADSLTII